MSASVPRTLLLGYGNPGRLDDGLGPALADRIAQAGVAGVTVETDYQLQVEDAALIAEHDVVIFADATVQGPEPFTLRPVKPLGEISFSTHSVSPGALLALARDHFDAKAEGWMLAIHGTEFNDFGEGLSEKAQANLEAAAEFITRRLEQHRIHDVA